MECGAKCSTPKSREALAIVTDDYMDVMALDPKPHMTTVTMASHFLYEKSRPDILLGPGGALTCLMPPMNMSPTTMCV
jgi:hypothetical protein